MVLGTNAANTKPVLKNFETKKVTITLKSTVELNKDMIEQEIVKSFGWICTVTNAEIVCTGVDMYGEYVYELEITIFCTWLDPIHV